MKLSWKILFYTNIVLALSYGLMGGVHLALGNTKWFFFCIGLAVINVILAKASYSYGYKSD